MKPRTSERQRKAEYICQKIGENIRKVRIKTPLTQADCSALIAGAGESYWRQVENGAKQFSLLRLVEIADALGVPAADLLEGV